MKLNFATLDVFTTERFAGNSLGVVFDADGIDGATMQVIAREFNHPETVFVLKPKAAGSTAGARIFTPGREMPFAGHPTVGTALVLTLRRGAGNDVVLEEKIGLVKCRVVAEGNDHGRSSFIIPAMPSEAGAAASREAIAAALGLAVDDIGFDVPSTVAVVGRQCLYVRSATLHRGGASLSNRRCLLVGWFRCHWPCRSFCFLPADRG